MVDSLRRRAWPLAAFAGISVASACTMAPEYTRPDAPVATEYPTAGDEGATAAELGWRDVFGDARLQKLIELALDNNRDLRMAALNVERVQALYRIERAPLFPRIDATGSATYQGVAEVTPGSQFAPDSLYSARVGVTAYELDFFGRIRSLSEAALQRYFATAEARRSAHLALVAQVAVAYLDERAAEEQLELATQTLELVEESFRITRRSFELGRSSELDLRTAESQVETARYNYAFYEQRRALAQNALVFLIGMPLPEDLPEAAPLVETSVRSELPAGMPSDLLQRRPDILAAEHQLLAANASIGAARAAFFPSITLTGAVGTSSTELSGLFGDGSGLWNFTPQINLPIFRGGALRANLDVAEITKSIEIANYERAIQAAFREVADGLAAKAAIEDRLEAQQRRVDAEQRRYQLAELRYRSGIDSYVTLLTAQRDLYTAQQSLIDAHRERMANFANLYKALGGGWLEHAEEPKEEQG